MCFWFIITFTRDPFYVIRRKRCCDATIGRDVICSNLDKLHPCLICKFFFHIFSGVHIPPGAHQQGYPFHSGQPRQPRQVSQGK